MKGDIMTIAYGKTIEKILSQEVISKNDLLIYLLQIRDVTTDINTRDLIHQLILIESKIQ